MWPFTREIPDQERAINDALMGQLANPEEWKVDGFTIKHRTLNLTLNWGEYKTIARPESHRLFVTKELREAVKRVITHHSFAQERFLADYINGLYPVSFPFDREKSVSIYLWLQENLDEDAYYTSVSHPSIIYFRDKDKAALYKLTWVGA
jgi:hypothetical protein